MRRDRFTPLQLEPLEDRLAPALTTVALDSGGNLNIRGTLTTGTLTLTYGMNNSVTVDDGANISSATFTVPGNVNVTLGNITNAATVTVDLDPNNPAAGSLNLNLGSSLGGYTVNTDAGTIAGALSITTGAGADVVNAMGTTVGGHVSLNLGGGSDLAIVSGVTTGGSLTGRGINFLPMDSTSVAGYVNLDTSSETGTDTAILILQNNTIHGDFIAKTASGPVVSNVINITDSSLLGNVVVTMGNNGSTNIFTISAGATVGKTVTATGGTGQDIFDLSACSIGGNVNLMLGSGGAAANVATLAYDCFVAGTAISIIGGDGRDEVNFAAIAPSAALNINLGAGNDTVTLGDLNGNGNPNVARATIDFGLGEDSLVLAPGFTIPFPTTLRN